MNYHGVWHEVVYKKMRNVESLCTSAGIGILGFWQSFKELNEIALWSECFLEAFDVARCVG